jgi:glutathione S-transferase
LVKGQVKIIGFLRAQIYLTMPAVIYQGVAEMILHDYRPSGNGHKVRLLCRYLNLDYNYREYDITQGESRTTQYLAMNPAGKIPVLSIDDDTHLAESNAILLYLAERFGANTGLIPESAEGRAELYAWLFWEQYSHEPNVASPRFWLTHGAISAEQEAQLPGRIEQGKAALARLDQVLSSQRFILGESLTLADFALFPYTCVCEEGGAQSLASFANVRRWLDDFSAHDWYRPITET